MAVCFPVCYALVLDPLTEGSNVYTFGTLSTHVASTQQALNKYLPY